VEIIAKPIDKNFIPFLNSFFDFFSEACVSLLPREMKKFGIILKNL